MRIATIFSALLATVSSGSTVTVAGSEEIARWSFEKSDEATGPTKISSRRVPNASSEFSTDVPGACLYDPLTKRSRANTASAKFNGSDLKGDAVIADLDDSIRSDRSLTIEAFVRPSPQAGGNSWLVGKSRATADGGELALQLVYLNTSNQTWHGAEVSTRAGSADRFPVGHYSSSTRLDADVSAWRHLAVSYDAETKRVTAWVDYHLSHTIKLDEPLAWDAGSFLIGGRADHWGTASLIDEVRVVGRVLEPSEFQRARADEIQGVSFASNQTVVPRDAGCLDAKEHFGAVGDGRTDDTAALNAAFSHLTSRVPLAYNTLIIPPGEYLISGTLYCSRFIDVKGIGHDRRETPVFTSLLR